MQDDLNTRKPAIGLLEWFEPGEHDRVDLVLKDLHRLGVDKLRTGFSWAEWRMEGGKEWYSWLMPYLADHVEVLPCFTYTPPELGMEPKCSSPPRDPQFYVDFIDEMLSRFDDCFEWIEFWNEPNNTNDWDWHLDPSWEIFSVMVRDAAACARAHDKKTVLAGMCPPDANWLSLMCERHVLDDIDAVGVHAFPGTWTYHWNSWQDTIGTVRDVLTNYGVDAELWTTEAGYSTWQHDEYRQLQEFVKALRAPVDRLYWYAAHDLAPDRSHQEGFHEDERHYHLGLRQANGRPKLLFRIWAEEGLEGIEEMAALGQQTVPVNGQDEASDCSIGNRKQPSALRNGERPVLITGGAGFVGANLAHRLLLKGEPVLVYDTLSRPGVEHNLRWLIETHGDRLSWVLEDIRNRYAVSEVVEQSSAVFHFAAQVAVTTSIESPREDFDINVRGMMNILEALRRMDDAPPLVMASTNKVYGDLGDIELQEQEKQYVPVEEAIRRSGIDESRPLDFYSPYGCSKGAADQYVLDYARTFRIPALALRMSCIYGGHQFGTEDQGWVAHFVRQTLDEEPITLYGDGKQVRDILFIDDFVQALLKAREHADSLAGQPFNIGGGPANAISLLELVDLAADICNTRPPLQFADWRAGDQKYYVSNTTRFSEATGWKPLIGNREGVSELVDWMRGSHVRDLSTMAESLT